MQKFSIKTQIYRLKKSSSEKFSPKCPGNFQICEIFKVNFKVNFENCLGNFSVFKIQKLSSRFEQYPDQIDSSTQDFENKKPYGLSMISTLRSDDRFRPKIAYFHHQNT